jgi:hypothetical protein
MDLSSRRLRAEVVTLPDDVAPLWAALYDAERKAYAAMTHRMTLESANTACGSCKEAACLHDALEQQDRDVELARKEMQLERQALNDALARVTPSGGGSPAETLALAWVLESAARTSGDYEHLPTALARPIDLYARVRSAEGIPGLWARYLRAGCLESADRNAEAKDEWRLLADAGSASFRLVPIADAQPFLDEAAVRLGTLEEEPSRALAAFGRARASRNPLLSVVATYEALLVTTEHGMPREALDAAVSLSTKPNFDEEVAKVAAWAFDATAGDVAADVELPTVIVARAALEGASLALARQDVLRAEALWSKVAALSPDTDLARQAGALIGHARDGLSRMPAVDARASMRDRLSALGRSCGERGSVDIQGAAVRPVTKPSAALARCIERHEVFFLSSEPPLPASKARLVVP